MCVNDTIYLEEHPSAAKLADMYACALGVLCIGVLTRSRHMSDNDPKRRLQSYFGATALLVLSCTH